MKPWEKYQNSKPWVKYDEGQEVFNPEALAQIEEGNRAYEQRQQDNRPWLDKSPIGRLGVAAIQGVANAGLNPAGYVARAAGMNTKPFQPQNAPERVSELFGQYGYDAATIAAGLGGMAQAGVGGTGVAGNVIKSMAEGGIPAAETLSLGSAFATGSIDPKNPYMRMVTDTVGGMFVPSVSRGIGTVGGLLRSNVKKGMDYLRSKFGDAYVDDMIREAEQKGLSLAEVADDRALKAVQMARQQTSAADDIVTQNAQAIRDNVSNKNTDTLNNMFGTKSGYRMKQEAEQAAMEKARPMYKELENISDLAAYETKDIPEQNFKRWFEGSKIVDENGQPLKLYHGTDANFDVFDMSKKRSTADIQGAFFSPYDIDAKGYGPNLKEVYLNIKNPADEQTMYKALRKYEGQKDAGLKAKMDLQRQGFDGVFNGYDEYIAFEPNQIKSVNNSGAWSSSPSLSDAGWKPESQLANAIKNNDVLADVIARVKRANSSLKNLPDTDFRVVNEARKALSQASLNRTDISGHEARMALNELDPMLDKIIPEYKHARGIYENAHQFAEAQKSAKDIFNKDISSEEFSDKFGKMTAEEKQALRGGLRDELFSIVENRENETLGWKRVVPKPVQSKIRQVLGVKDGDKLIEYAQSQLKSMRNLNKILGGSNTAEKLDAKNTVSTAVEALGNPTRSVGIMLKRAPWNNSRNMGIAQIMTNPSADLARSTYEQVASPRGWEAVYQALYNPRGFTKYNTALAAYLAGRELQQ